MGKRYYWLKLPEDFFGDKAIKRLRKIAGGDTYVIIYLKMMLRSLKDDGYLYYDGLEEDFPAELALDLDEEEDNVQVTLNFLLQHGKLEIRSEQEYFMPDMKQSIGSETAAAEPATLPIPAEDESRTKTCRTGEKTTAIVTE